MLVLSRRLNEKILLPNINTTIQVVAVKPGMVRLGITAPPEITVLREEVGTRTAEWGNLPTRTAEPATSGKKPHKLYQQLGDRLKVTGVGLGLLRLQLESGLTQDAKETLARIQDDFNLLRCGVEGELEEPLRNAPKKPRKALLVEDDHNERELLAGFLRMSGLEVDTAGDGCDALDYLRSHARPDVVLCDMMLPRCDGPTVVREIRRNPAYAGLKIFGLTGHLPDEFDLDNGPAGIDRWFSKPLDPTALLDDLSRELDKNLCSR